MKRKGLFLSLAVVLIAVQLVFAHDPRTVAKEFSHTMNIEGAGKLTLTYKSLHYNEGAYQNAMKNERVLTNLNRLWKSIGKFESDFDVEIAGVKVPKGSYTMGINFDASNNYKLILGAGGNDITIPLQFAADSPVVVNFLSFDVRPQNDTDTFVFEGRYGKLRASAEVKVPYLAPHEHGEKKAEKN
ncbi:MAG TPA: hypothetical protein VNO70_11925 [Blastocatellia bacterium]|nr:hypothetical protein [Blastocatellia bacterium]